MCAVALSCCAASSSSLERRLKRSPASMTISRRTVEHVFGTRKGIVNLPIQDRIPALKAGTMALVEVDQLRLTFASLAS